MDNVPDLHCLPKLWSYTLSLPYPLLTPIQPWFIYFVYGNSRPVCASVTLQPTVAGVTVVFSPLIQLFAGVLLQISGINSPRLGPGSICRPPGSCLRTRHWQSLWSPNAQPGEAATTPAAPKQLQLSGTHSVQTVLSLPGLWSAT